MFQSDRVIPARKRHKLIMDTGTANRSPLDPYKKPSLPLQVGEAEAKLESAAIDAGTNGVYRFCLRHPWWYGIIAFVIGSGFIGLFTMTTYSAWVIQAIDLKTAVYQVIFGSIGGGIVMVILAFAYARTVRSIRPWTARKVTVSDT